jgi:hypothetical protein
MFHYVMMEVASSPKRVKVILAIYKFVTNLQEIKIPASRPFMYIHPQLMFIFNTFNPRVNSVPSIIIYTSQIYF